MNIQKSNSVNFQGGYKLIRVPAEAKNEIPLILPRGKIVYENFEGKKNNIFLLVRKNFDKVVNNFIVKHNLKYKYYPELSVKMRNLNEGEEKELLEVLQHAKEDYIKHPDIIKQEKDKRLKLNEIREKSPIYIDNILNALYLETPDKKDINTISGIKIINYKDKKIYISPPGDYGIHYVKIENLKSTTDESGVLRFSITSDGKILHNYSKNIDDLFEFNKIFKSLLIK